MHEPHWLVRARRYIGLSEVPGKANNPTILKWWVAIKTAFIHDSVPWCAGFVGGVLEECGIQSTRSAAARSYLNFGKKIDKPALGCVVVFWRGNPKGYSGHVGFVVGRDANHNLMVLGGNQGDAVNIKPFSPSRVLGYRWPGITPRPERYNLPLLKSNGDLSTNEA